MKTDAIEHKNTAIENVDKAIKNLSAIVISKCEGYEELTSDYKYSINENLNSLLIVRENLEELDSTEI